MSDKKKKKRIDPDREILISVHDLRKSFDGQEVLKGINFVVHRGEVVSIIGPSGCGKSTLIRSLNLLEQPDSGSIRFEDEEIVGLHEREQNKVREKIGMVFQQFNLFKNKTVLDNITLAPVKLGLMKPDKAKEEAMRLLERIGLADDPYNEDFDAKADGEEGEDPIHELKRLYRQIVKRLHPDVHPNQTEREKDLLDRANKAYKAGDVEEMRRIWEELAGTEQTEESFEDTEEGRDRLRELIRTLRKRCKALEEEIRHIKTSFPYTAKALLDDDKALEMKRQELLDQLAEVRALLEKVDEYIAELKRRMNEKKHAE